MNSSLKNHDNNNNINSKRAKWREWIYNKIAFEDGIM